MESGVSENGVFYYGAVYRERLPKQTEPAPVIESYDPDAPDELNARRFFGFTDYEPLDIFILRSRYQARKGSAIVRELAERYYEILRYTL